MKRMNFFRKAFPALFGRLFRALYNITELITENRPHIVAENHKHVKMPPFELRLLMSPSEF